MCDLTIKLSNPTASKIKVLANIQVHKIVIDAPNTVLQVAKDKNISVSGGSFSVRGTDLADTVKRGAQFIGQGGYCDDSTIFLSQNLRPETVYKQHIENWVPETFIGGSMGL